VVAAGVRGVGMESQLPGVLVGGFLSLVVAVVVLFVQRYLRERGGIYREIYWTTPLLTGSTQVFHGLECKFENQKDVNTSLWDIRLEFHKDGMRVGNPLTCYFSDTKEPLYLLNLPSHVAVVLRMEIRIEGDTLDAVKDILRPFVEADGAVFVAGIPGGEEFRQELGGRPTWPDWDLERMPAIEAQQGASEAAETVEEERERAEFPRPTVESQEGVQRRSWWRRVFGG
jgi:hypothetical protein